MKKDMTLKTLTLFLLSLLLTTNAAAQNIVDWKKQLQELIEQPDSIMTANALRLTGWTEGKVLETDRDVIEYERILLDEKNYLPQYDGENIELMRMGDIRKAFSKHQMEYVYPDIIRQILLGSLAIHMQAVELQWEYKGKHFTTPAVVDRIQGVVYDHILSNVFIPKIEVTRQTSRKEPEPDAFYQGETLELTETVTGVVYNLIRRPLFVVTLTHTAKASRDKSTITSCWGENVSGNRTSGYPMISGDIQYRWVANEPGKDGFSKVVYAWYLTAGRAKGTITWNDNEPVLEGGASSFGKAYFMKGISLIKANDPEWKTID